MAEVIPFEVSQQLPSGTEGGKSYMEGLGEHAFDLNKAILLYFNRRDDDKSILFWNVSDQEGRLPGRGLGKELLPQACSSTVSSLFPPAHPISHWLLTERFFN